jgi:hypothetical protein
MIDRHHRFRLSPERTTMAAPTANIAANSASQDQVPTVFPSTRFSVASTQASPKIGSSPQPACVRPSVSHSPRAGSADGLPLTAGSIG